MGSVALALDRLNFGYGHTPVIDNLSVSLAPGELFALLGVSGSGKTSLLQLIAGHLRPRSGRISLGGRDVTALPPERRRIGLVYQNYSLFPHLTARGNVAFGLEVRGLPRTEIAARVDALLDRVGLDAAQRERLPSQLSGGQQQRVALARALVIDPEVLLLDEPFANLDPTLRQQMRQELRQVQRPAGVATLLVTHDAEEALALADTLGVLESGRLLQVGPPREVYRQPRSPVVARALGEACFLRITQRSDSDLTLEDSLTLNPIPAHLRACPVGVRVMYRPEDFTLNGPWPGEVIALTFLGYHCRVEIQVGTLVLAVLLFGPGVPAVGERVSLGVAPQSGWPLSTEAEFLQ